AEPVRPDHARIDRIAFDRVLRDALADQLDGVGGRGIQPARALRSELAEQRVLAERIAAEHEPAIAAGRAVTNAVALEQHYVAHTALREAKRQAHPGITAADDRDAGFSLPLQRRQLGEGTGACGVPGRWRHRAKHTGSENRGQSALSRAGPSAA